MKTRIIQAAALVLFTWTAAIAQGPVVRTDRQVYYTGEKIVVEFSGLPGSVTDWLAISSPSSPDRVSHQSMYTKGQRAGTMTFIAERPGKYEVRVYYDYPRGGDVVQTRLGFTVADGKRSLASVLPPQEGETRDAYPRVNSTAVDREASDLAKAILANDDKSLSALITALQKSGIAVRGPDGSLEAKPSEPWQGIIYESWEVPLLLNMMRKNGSASVKLVDLTQTIQEIAPVFAKVPVADLIVAQIGAYSQSDIATRRFFARLFIELGRNAHAHRSYDLLRSGKAADVNLDGIQTSLIIRRFEMDMMMLAGSEGITLKPLIQDAPVYRLSNFQRAARVAAPCTMTSTERTIMDVVGYGTKFGLRGIQVFDVGWQGLYKYLDTKGVGGLGDLNKALGYVSIFHTYAKLIYTYAALTVDISIDREPLIRTKRLRPMTGEGRHRLVALVRMDGGSLQTINCFRFMFNAVGLNFNVPQNGVLKNVRIAWDGRNGFDQAVAALHGGPDAIVQFVANPNTRIQEGGTTASGLNPITNQLTDAGGKAFIDVEGVGQRREVRSDAKKVAKHARVGVQVALKGGDLIGDVVGAGLDSIGGVKLLYTLPAAILLRMKWATSGSLSFNVTDWRNVDEYEDECQP